MAAAALRSLAGSEELKVLFPQLAAVLASPPTPE
jgi:hypothetical protein